MRDPRGGTYLAHEIEVRLKLKIFMPEGHGIPPEELSSIEQDLRRVAEEAITLSPPSKETLHILGVRHACEWETAASCAPRNEEKDRG